MAYKKASLNYSEKRNTIYSCYYSIGKLYGNLHKLDSALLFAEMALASTDLYVECGANWLIYTLYVKSRIIRKHVHIMNVTFTPGFNRTGISTSKIGESRSFI